MDEIQYEKYDVEKTLDPSQIPEDTITVVIKSGTRTYVKGVYLEETQEETAKLATVIMQAVIDTVDAKGLKKGGSLYDPSNPQNSGKVAESGDN